MNDVRWLTEDEERAWKALQLMQMRLTARLASDVAATSELSSADYVVLVSLSDADGGRMRLFELGVTVGWEKSRLSHQIARMSSRGLVVKQPCDDDRRGAYIVMTERGHAAIAAAAPRHVEMVRALFVDRLEPGELETIGAVAEKILGVLNDDTLNAPDTGPLDGHRQTTTAHRTGTTS